MHHLLAHKLADISHYLQSIGVDLGMNYAFHRAMWNLRHRVYSKVGRVLSRIAISHSSPTLGWGRCAWSVASPRSTQWRAISLRTTDQFSDFPLWSLWCPLRRWGGRPRAWSLPSIVVHVCRTFQRWKILEWSENKALTAVPFGSGTPQFAQIRCLSQSVQTWFSSTNHPQIMMHY